MKNFTLRGGLTSIFIAIVSSLLSTASFAQGGCANAVSNVVFFNQTATTVDVTFTNPISSTVTVEWGASCFQAGTGPTAISSNDTATLSGLDSGQCYNVFFFNSGCMTLETYCSPCPTSGNDANNPLKANLDSIASGINFYEYVKTGTEYCYTNAHSFTPDVDVVWEYVPSPGATEINISTCSSHDTTRLFVLDSNQQLISTTNTTCGVGQPTPWNTIFKSEKIDGFQVDPNMRYYIVVEIEQNDTCGSGIYFSIEETVSANQFACSSPYNLDSVISGCDAMLVTWSDSSNASSYLVEYGVSGFTVGNGTMVTVMDTFQLLSNLSASAMYDVYVSAICSSDTSAPSGPFVVSTSNASGQSAMASHISSFLGIINNEARFQFDGTASMADSLIWNFGDGSAWEVGWTPTHGYSAAGVYNVALVAILGCSVDTALFTVNAVPWSIEEQLLASVKMYPNPTSGIVNIDWSEDLTVLDVKVMDNSGRLVLTQSSNGSTLEIDMTEVASGVYVVQLATQKGLIQIRLILQ